MSSPLLSIAGGAPAHDMASVSAELDAMKAQGVERTQLSHHAADALFFKLRERPSVLLVRQLTRTGSNSDISRDLDDWWAKLRENSSLNLHADLQGLADTVTPLLRELLGEANKVAQAKLDAERARLEAQDRERAGYAEAQVRHAQAMQQEAQNASTEAHAATARAREALEHEKSERTAQVQGLRHEMAVAAERAAAAEQLAVQREADLRHALAEAREQLQAAQAAMEEQRQHAAREKGFLEDRRRLLEGMIAEGKAVHAQLQASNKALEAQVERLEKQAAAAEERQAKKVADLTLALGEASGQARAVEGERDRLATQLEAARDQAARLGNQVAEAQASRDVLAGRVHQALPRLAVIRDALLAKFDVSAEHLEELVFQALTHEGKLPPALRKREGADSSELLEAVEKLAARRV